MGVRLIAYGLVLVTLAVLGRMMQRSSRTTIAGRA